MPRSGSGSYSLPPNTEAVPNTPIESAKFNTLIADLAADANNARPISAGGTGANNAAGARDALGIGDAGGDDVVAIAHGGTGGTTAILARTNLDLQGIYALLVGLAAATGAAANKLPYLTSATAWAYATVSTFARTLLDDADAPAMRTTLGLGSLSVLDVADQFYAGSTAGNVAFPIGSYLLAGDSDGAIRNQTVTVRLGGDTLTYTTDATGTVVTGTWKARGRIPGSGTLLVQRVA